MNNTVVGELIDPHQPRDAIHIAVAPVIAAQTLAPGQHIGFTGEDTVHVMVCEPAMAVGIVDPFLTVNVLEGQACWMFLRPNTITSLRHDWTHPAFSGHDDTAKVMAKQWMDNFAGGFGVPVEEMIQAGHNWIKNGSYYSDGGTFEGETVPDEYWDNFQEITGVRVKSGQRDSFFTCSC